MVALNSCQKEALNSLQGHDNIFLTGAAGSGKSFLIRRFLKGHDPKTFPMLASTGAAAILVGGRTFHSFFGLGILEGGAQATIERALKNRRVTRRLEKTDGVIIDEISMIGGATLQVAETIARKARGKDRPWGGMRIVAVGDFAQLPPVNRFQSRKDWAFLDRSWVWSDFKPVVLTEIMRTNDPEFLNVLNAVREGRVTAEVTAFLRRRSAKPEAPFEGTRLFARKVDTEHYNLERLAGIEKPLVTLPTTYTGEARLVQDFKRHAPIPELIHLKEGALVMLRQNDPEGRWINGSTGYLRHISPQALQIELLNGRHVEVAETSFTLLDAEGKPVVSAHGFPVNLAYSITIHKAQGLTLDKMAADLCGFWEPGQAYVALSRVTAGSGLFVENWDAKSIIVDPAVIEFHKSL